MKASGEPMSIDRPMSAGLIASVVVVPLKSANHGPWLIGRPC